MVKNNEGMGDIEQILLNRVKIISDGEWTLFGTPNDVIKELEALVWDRMHTKHNVGDVVGDYKITDRFKRIGKNTKFRVVCVHCGRPMFRYSNKFKLPHKGCPAYYGKSAPTKQNNIIGKE